jgi:hypothetical protein
MLFVLASFCWMVDKGGNASPRQQLKRTKHIMIRARQRRAVLAITRQWAWDMERSREASLPSYSHAFCAAPSFPAFQRPCARLSQSGSVLAATPWMFNIKRCLSICCVDVCGASSVHSIFAETAAQGVDSMSSLTLANAIQTLTIHRSIPGPSNSDLSCIG